MRRISLVDMAGFAVAAIFILAGAGMVLFPTPTAVEHGTFESARPSPDYEIVSSLGVRIYGLITIVIGCGIAALMVYLVRNPSDEKLDEA